MTTNKPGSIHQRPLYGCTSCYEDYSWPADDLCVYENECWCEICWEDRSWDFMDQPRWGDLGTFTPRAAVPEGYILVPTELTAENGAKAALMGEFSVKVNAPCEACERMEFPMYDGECDDCNSTGFVKCPVTIGWPTLKEIHKAMVAHFAAQQPEGVKQYLTDQNR